MQNHGYDNDEPSMYAMFVAHGPFSNIVKDIHARRSASGLFSRQRKDPGWDPKKDAYIINGFENVQVYNLVMKLLGIGDHAAKTNGTAGFWDKYF